MWETLYTLIPKNQSPAEAESVLNAGLHLGERERERAPFVKTKSATALACCHL